MASEQETLKGRPCKRKTNEKMSAWGLKSLKLEGKIQEEMTVQRQGEHCKKKMTAYTGQKVSKVKTKHWRRF